MKLLTVKYICEVLFWFVAVAAACMVLFVIVFESEECRKQRVYLRPNRSSHDR